MKDTLYGTSKRYQIYYQSCWNNDFLNILEIFGEQNFLQILAIIHLLYLEICIKGKRLNDFAYFGVDFYKYIFFMVYSISLVMI